jgi:uncharacterized membrane protein YfcA
VVALIGVIVLAMLVVNHIRSHKQDAAIPTQWWFAAVMGLLAGFTTMMANAAGPVMVIYLLAMRLPAWCWTVRPASWYRMGARWRRWQVG